MPLTHTRRAFVTASIFTFMALAAGPAGDAGAKKELAALQGTWKLVSLETDGEKTDLPEPGWG